MATMADDVLEDYVYSPPVERIVSDLEQLECHGREGTSLPSAITWLPMYSCDDVQRPVNNVNSEGYDHKEVWMGNFADGAFGERHAKWYATNLRYRREGKEVVRKTLRGGSWNLRAPEAFDAKNCKILIPLKEIKRNKCKVSWFKRTLRYVIGKKRTPWKMVEYTLAKDKPNFAICKIIPVSPIEPSKGSDQFMAVGAQDGTTTRFRYAALNDDGLSPNQVGINYPARSMETSRGTEFGAPTNCQPSIRSNVLSFSFHPGQLHCTAMETLDAMSPMAVLLSEGMDVPSQQIPLGSPTDFSVEGHQLQQGSHLGTHCSPYPNQMCSHINLQEAWNEGNDTIRMDHSLLPQGYVVGSNIGVMPRSPNVTHQADLSNSPLDAFLQFPSLEGVTSPMAILTPKVMGIPSQQAPFGNLTNFSIEAHQLQQKSHPGMYCGPYSSQHINLQEAWNEGNATNEIDYSLLAQGANISMMPRSTNVTYQVDPSNSHLDAFSQFLSPELEVAQGSLLRGVIQSDNLS